MGFEIKPREKGVQDGIYLEHNNKNRKACITSLLLALAILIIHKHIKYIRDLQNSRCFSRQLLKIAIR